MIELEAFVQGQHAVYDKFRRLTIREEGTTPPKTVENRDGYLVIIQHPDEIIQRCANFSRKIAQVVPAMEYERITVHTTLAVVGMQYRDPGLQQLDQSTMSLLQNALHSVAANFSRVSIPYEGWLYNRDTTVAWGIAGNDFVQLVDLIHESLAKYNAVQFGKVQQPWGAHITVSRFLEYTPPEQLADFFHVVENEPALPPSTPEAVCLGYVSVKEGKVGIGVMDQFLLKQ